MLKKMQKRLLRSHVRSSSPVSSNRGGTLVEAAVALPIFLLLVFFIIDLARYFFAAIVLQWAAHNGVDLASKLEVETDTKLCASGPLALSAAELENCNRYERIVQRVIARTLDTASLVTSPSSSGSMTRRTTFEHYSDGDQADLRAHFFDEPSEHIADVAFLRPGEKAMRSDGTFFEHPTRPFGDTDTDGVGWPGPTETWTSIVEQEPLVVRVEVDFNPITPLLPNIMLAATEFGFRRPRVFGTGRSPVPIQSCGDGDPDEGEVCDPGIPGQEKCAADCSRIMVCGDGERDPGETCDDGNTNNSDGCSADCKTETCGDTVIQAPREQCDDGNTTNGDGCNSDCQREGCGNATPEPLLGEACDDGPVGSRSCTKDCQWRCAGEAIPEPLYFNAVKGEWQIRSGQDAFICNTPGTSLGPNNFCDTNCTVLCGNQKIDGERRDRGWKCLI